MTRRRTIAIGDIHGCGKALRTIIEEIDPSADDTLVFMGDYVDRGPDSRGVIEQLLELQPRTNLIPLLGNHEIMFLSVASGKADEQMWLACGGAATLTSYGGALQHVPDSHLEFLRGCHNYWEDAQNIFVHAFYAPGLPMDQQPEQTMFWEHLPPVIPNRHISSKRVIVGHTPQESQEVLDMGHLVCVDTYCFGGGWLTAFDTATGDVWQADRKGHVRRDINILIWQRMRKFLRQLWGQKEAGSEAASSDDQ